MCIGAPALAIVSLVASALGTIAQVQSQRAAAKAAKQRAEYEAAVARNNQIFANRLADDALARGKIAETEQRKRVKQLQAAQRVAAAGQGVVVDEGSALDLTADTAALGELDALTIRNNAEREALGFRTQGINFQTSAALAQMRAFQPSTTGATILGGISRVSSQFATFRQEGIL